MKTSKVPPPNWDKIAEKFHLDWKLDNVIVTYGDVIYCQTELSDQKLIHETVHVKQQKDFGVDKWWQAYFDNPNFRLAQEEEAYKAEAEWIKLSHLSRDEKYRRLRRIALDLSGKIYGNIISYDEAIKMLR